MTSSSPGLIEDARRHAQQLGRAVADGHAVGFEAVPVPDLAAQLERLRVASGG